ncbi:MAG: hypothetical protein SFY69_10405 [Planctomycetota bacterium]|nr:hypothetical protein [Planctomycetota bacterium]
MFSRYAPAAITALAFATAAHANVISSIAQFPASGTIYPITDANFTQQNNGFDVWVTGPNMRIDAIDPRPSTQSGGVIYLRTDLTPGQIDMNYGSGQGQRAPEDRFGAVITFTTPVEAFVFDTVQDNEANLEVRFYAADTSLAASFTLFHADGREIAPGTLARINTSGWVSSTQALSRIEIYDPRGISGRPFKFIERFGQEVVPSPATASLLLLSAALFRRRR